MGRPDYDDSVAGSDDPPAHLTTQGDTTGWLQHGHDLGEIEFRGRE